MVKDACAGEAVVPAPGSGDRRGLRHGRGRRHASADVAGVAGRPGRRAARHGAVHATSAVCVTGLVAVDTPTYWSGFGQAVILLLIQVGGFGIMTLASLVGLLLSRRMGLRTRLTAAAETKSLGIGDVRAVLVGVAKVSLLFESVTAVLLTARFLIGYDEPWPRAVYHGVFHAVSAFNNAGFALYSDSLIGFVDRPVDLRADCRGGHLRRPRLPGAVRAAPTARATAAVEPAHQAHGGHDRGPAGAGHALRAPVSEWSNPGTLGTL